MSAPIPTPASLLATFTRHAAAADAEVVEVAGEGELRTAIAALTTSTDGTPLQAVGTSAAAGLGFPAPTAIDEVLRSEVTVAMATAGVAETGSVALTPSTRLERLAHVLSPVHVVVLPASRLCDTLDVALAQLRGSMAVQPSPYVTFVTGPSRTADIERVITVGAHGPRRLVVLVAHEWEPGAGTAADA